MGNSEALITTTSSPVPFPSPSLTSCLLSPFFSLTFPLYLPFLPLPLTLPSLPFPSRPLSPPTLVSFYPFPSLPFPSVPSCPLFFSLSSLLYHSRSFFLFLLYLPLTFPLIYFPSRVFLSLLYLPLLLPFLSFFYLPLPFPSFPRLSLIFSLPSFNFPSLFPL